MGYILILLIDVISQVVILVVIADVLLSYFMDPYHPVRATLDRLVAPLLDPIRRVVPLVGMFDISPIILIILVQLIARLLISVISR